MSKDSVNKVIKQPLDFPKCSGSRTNFTKEEVKSMLEHVKRHNKVIEGKNGAISNNSRKLEVWKKIQDQLVKEGE